MRHFKNKIYHKATFLARFILLILLFTGISQLISSQTLSNDKPENKTEAFFPVKGFHLDLRIQVMTMPALKEFAKELADFGINTLVMEWEASFPYSKHATISNEYAYTRDEVKDFVAYCDNLGIEVIPLQQCFGHVEYILQHGRYNHLKESRTDLSQVCPLKVDADKQLFKDLFEDMASLHKSKYIHVGCDETRLLGRCSECAKKVQKEGKSKLFADYLSMICKIVTDMGKTPVLWADIVLDNPDVVDQLPKETVYIDWNYGWNINYFGDIGKLLDKGLNFWGSPAIRSHPDNWYTIDWQKHFNNQRDFIPYARKAGYKGVVMTSWSTSGVYGYNWDTNYEVIDLYAMRNVYPLSGFRILIAAYAQSLKQTEPLNPEKFVTEYAQERFGFSENEGEKLWEILIASPALARVENQMELDTIYHNVKKVKELMTSLVPKSHQKEFKHLQLMIDLRLFYLDFKKVESVYESYKYNREIASKILPVLERLLKESKKLDERFTELNKDFLYPEEIEEQNRVRVEKLEKIYNIVANANK